MKYTIGGILLAGGDGQKIAGGAEVGFLNVGSLPGLARGLMTFEACHEVQTVVVVADAQRVDTVRAMAHRYGGTKLSAVAPAFQSRTANIASALAALPPEVDLLVIHEVSRPLVTANDITEVIQIAARGKGGAATAFLVAGGVRTGPRKRPTVAVPSTGPIWLVSSPMACLRAFLEKGLTKAKKNRHPISDETDLMDLAGVEISLVECGEPNLRIR
ncbi:MAG: 2-C-methyl-D-erythritol 4-phosphate cytidylyltransferase, partial [Kiritimatiellia bacterium]|nr:2-C-methyl-D-erythritol 4-phosphate cytidylyltransferase [Kiritimatiellia bacterium]